MEDTWKLSISVFLTALAISSYIGMRWWNYTQNKQTNLVCNRILAGSRFSSCHDISGFGYSDKYKVRVCQSWGSRNTTSFLYCEDYYYNVNNKNITIWRVR